MSDPAAPTTDAPGHIIFLNRIPNAGKTTLADGVQGTLEEPYSHLSLDDFLRGYDDHHPVASMDQLFPKVIHGYLRSLRQLALGGTNIVAEAVITPDRLQLYLDLFRDLPILLVGLHIPVEEARRRERERTDRHQPYDVTTEHLEMVHAHGFYDLELDMSICPGGFRPISSTLEVAPL